MARFATRERLRKCGAHFLLTIAGLACSSNATSPPSRSAPAAEAPRPLLRQVNERATPHPQRQPKLLNPVDRWRLEYVLRAIEPLSRRWPWTTTQRTCTMLISLQTQRVMNCDHAPAADFSREADDFRGRPVFAQAGTELMLEGS